MADLKGRYKLKIVDKTGDSNVVDLLYGASSEEFVTWLKHSGRVYVPFYTGLQISPEERTKEVALVEKAGKLTSALTGEGEVMEFEK